MTDKWVCARCGLLVFKSKFTPHERLAGGIQPWCNGKECFGLLSKKRRMEENRLPKSAELAAMEMDYKRDYNRSYQLVYRRTMRAAAGQEVGPVRAPLPRDKTKRLSHALLGYSLGRLKRQTMASPDLRIELTSLLDALLSTSVGGEFDDKVIALAEGEAGWTLSEKAVSVSRVLDPKSYPELVFCLANCYVQTKRRSKRYYTGAQLSDKEVEIGLVVLKDACREIAGL